MRTKREIRDMNGMERSAKDRRGWYNFTRMDDDTEEEVVNDKLPIFIS